MAGIEMPFIGLEQRQPPERVGRRFCRRDDAVGGIITIGEQRRQFGAERHPRGAGQRGEINHEVGLVLAGQRDRIGKDKPPLGVGVADLDRQTGAGVDDIKRPHRFR